MLKKPTLIIIHGFPATGKTRLAKKISRSLKLPVFSADEIKEAIFNRVGSLENGLFDPISKASYELMYKFASSDLSVGRSCIIEAFLKKEIAEREIKKIKNKFKFKIVQIHLIADPDTIKRRYTERIKKGERHFCHLKNIPDSKYFELKGRSRSINVGGKIKIIDTTDFREINNQKTLYWINKIV